MTLDDFHRTDLRQHQIIAIAGPSTYFGPKTKSMSRTISWLEDKPSIERLVGAPCFAALTIFQAYDIVCGRHHLATVSGHYQGCIVAERGLRRWLDEICKLAIICEYKNELDRP